MKKNDTDFDWMQKTIGHHREIYEEMGFRICEDMIFLKEFYSSGTSFTLIHEYVIPECIGVMRTVAFKIVDYWTQACGGTKKDKPFISISSQLLSLAHMPKEVYDNNEKLAWEIANHRHPKRHTTAYLKRYDIINMINCVDLYNISLNEEISDDDLKFELNTAFRLTDAIMKSAFGYERTTLQI